MITFYDDDDRKKGTIYIKMVFSSSSKSNNNVMDRPMIVISKRIGFYLEKTKRIINVEYVRD